jgi:hypothetical protein
MGRSIWLARMTFGERERELGTFLEKKREISLS